MIEEFTLFTSALLAATILPFSSEILFVGAIANGMPIANALISASLGNIIGISINYALGVFLYKKTKTKLKSSKVGRGTLFYGRKYGYYALLLSWLPIVGDPLTAVSGVVRLNFLLFIVMAGGLRVLRYFVLAIVV